MAFKQVHSSHIDGIAYDEATGDLHVNYKRGKPVVYRGVPPDVAGQVMDAGSVGTALHLLVKGVYGHEYKSDE